MALVEYGVSRNMTVVDEHGKELQAALILIKHENGYTERLIVREDLIRFAGEQVIDDEVKRALNR